MIVLFSLALVRLEPDCCIQFWTLQFKRAKLGKEVAGERKRGTAKAKRYRKHDLGGKVGRTVFIKFRKVMREATSFQKCKWWFCFIF